MKSIMFNPFDKPVDDLKESDLKEKLADVCEIWYVEYKGPDILERRSDSDKAKIARTIASFANKFGGWLFIGIDADEKNRPKLDDIPGAAPDMFTAQDVYNICSSRVSPTPYFRQVAVELTNGNVVLAVMVPESPDPPHIDIQTGKVYVRTGNVSEPLEEITNRAELDRLYSKAQENRGHVEALLQRHQHGERFLHIVRHELEQSKQAIHLGREYPPFAPYAIVSYPMSRTPELFEFPLQRLFPQQVRELVREKGDPAGIAAFLSPLYSTVKVNWLDQSSVYLLSADWELVYIDAFGHIGFAGIASSPKQPPHSLVGAVYNEVVEHLESFTEACQILYGHAQYWGSIGLNCLVQLPYKRIRPAAELQTSVPNLKDDANITQIKGQLYRLLGLWDSQ